MPEIDYKKRCEQYEKMFGIGDYDPVKDAYIVYIKMLNQQVEFLNEFTIKSSITETDKDSPKYKRAMEMVDGLPKMIAAVDDLKSRLKLSKEDLLKIQPEKPIFSRITTPESIADNVGGLAGARN
jgi:hypothetical protein